MTMTTFLELDGEDAGEVEVQVTGRYVPGTRDVMYLSNGDPGYPGDPSEGSIQSVVRLDTKQEVLKTLSPKQLDAVLDAFLEEGDNREIDGDFDDQSDRAYDAWRDREIEDR